MRNRATLQMAALAGLIALGAGAVEAKGPDAAMIFGEIDADGNGQITAEEMTAYAAARFAKADANGDGALDAAEMAAAGAEGGGKRAQRMLERFDTDGSGTLDSAELEKIGEGRHGRRIQRLDADGDGKLTLAEMTAKRDPARMISRLDENGDGMLSAEEFGKMRERGKRHGGAAQD